MSRRLRPRAPIATAPSHVSQLTVEALFGVDSRRFLELLRDHANELTVTAIGKLRVVSVDDLRELLSRLALASSSTRVEVDADAGDADNDDDQPATADEVLARLGRRRSS